MEEQWRLWDRVTHIYRPGLWATLTEKSHKDGYVDWTVALVEGGTTCWYEENLLPEPPLEALARVAREFEEQET